MHLCSAVKPTSKGLGVLAERLEKILDYNYQNFYHCFLVSLGYLISVALFDAVDVTGCFFFFPPDH